MLVPVSEYVRRRFIAAGWDPEQLVAKPNVVYPEPQVMPREIRRQVLFVGRDTPDKGLHVLIEALRRLGPDAPRLVVAGGRSAARRCRTRSSLGPVPHARVLDLMAESMAVVVPSVWAEPFGRVAIEAQAVGTPAIVSNIGGLPETYTLLTVRPGDAADLAAAIEFMASWYDDPDDEVYQTARRAARTSYEGHFAPARQIERLEWILGYAIERRQARTMAHPVDAVA